MGGSCGTHWINKKIKYSENLKLRNHFGDLGVDGRVTLNRILKQ